MEKLDFIKWEVKQGLYWVSPYTSVEIAILNMDNNNISLVRAARNIKLMCNGFYRQQFARNGQSENNAGNGIIRIPMPTPSKEFFMLDSASGYFQKYGDFHKFNMKKFLNTRNQYTISPTHGTIILPKSQGEVFARNILNFAENQKKSWFKDEILDYIAQQTKIYTK